VKSVGAPIGDGEEQIDFCRRKIRQRSHVSSLMDGLRCRFKAKAARTVSAGGTGFMPAVFVRSQAWRA
jgi:hypothetical protein